MADRRDEPIEARLGRLRDSTGGLTPPAGLGERLAAAYRGARPPIARGIEALVLPLGRRALIVAAIAAAASLALACNGQRVADETNGQILESAGWEP